MKKSVFLVLIFTLALGLASAQAGQFVSLNGKFQLNYPDDWQQLDYRTVDSALFGGKQYGYEGAFAPKSATLFLMGDYLVVTVDTVGSLNQHQTDSMLSSWAATLGAAVKRYGPAEDFAAFWRPVEVSYWPKSGLASVYTDTKVAEGQHTRNQLIIKFYDRGTVNFYFYGPDSTWSAYEPVIASVVNSFSTENVEASLPHQQVKVVDAKQLEERSDGSSAPSGISRSVTIYGSIAVVLILIFVIRVALRKKGRTPSNN